ncbi:toxin-antitoxin system, toxin component [Streptomyces sp. NPDC006512]|uniref:toxin-antitoxin system, toxin component n=1 Tax=Streptomyces sp. NPDC006512 TaxID=3154307 RepID=UPI0033AD5E39
MLGTSREMKRYRDELFAGVGRPVPQQPRELIQALCAHVAASVGREVRVMFESFPADTVSGLWIDMGDFDLIVVEENTSPLHQIVIAAHELWHRKEAHHGRPGGHGGHGGLAGDAAARLLGDRWQLADALAHVAARGDVDLDDEERRAETFGRLVGAKFRPYLGRQGDPASGEGLVGRIKASLEG